MQRFTQLYLELDETTRTNEKVAALHRYFSEAPARDAAWALFFLTGQKLPRAVSSPQLRQWTAEKAGLPMWLLEECYDAIGDLAETAALLFPEGSGERMADGVQETSSRGKQGPAPPAEAPQTPGSQEPARSQALHTLIEERLVPLRALPEAERRALLLETWEALDQRQRFVWNKLITGEFRVGVARTLVVRALAGVAGVEPAVMAHRLMGHWRPTAEDFIRIMSGEEGADDPRRPYPFYLAYPLEPALPKNPDLRTVNAELEKLLGPVTDWQAEWKWDGIRAQLIRRGEDVVIWSRGEDLITDRFPEIAAVGRLLPDGTALDGEILAWRGDRPLRFGDLQKRITVKNVSKKLLADVAAAFMAYDLMEYEGRDLRSEPLAERRAILEDLVGHLYVPLEESAEDRGQKTEDGEEPPGRPLPSASRAEARRREAETTGAAELWTHSEDLPIRLSPVLHAAKWSDLALLRAESRENDAEGLMLKRLAGPYQVGRVRGDWWKWKIDPHTVDAVLVYAQPGHGKRASLYTDYTFALWRGDELVPVAKAYSGLTDAEIKDVDAWIRRNTVERFGPVRTVKPELVFEIAFEGIQLSPRHKSGIAVRFPRILRWRHDKSMEDADTLDTLKELAGLGSE